MPRSTGQAERPALLLLTQAQLVESLQVSRTGLWHLRNLPKGDPRRFPEPLQLGQFCLRWKVVDVMAWIDRQTGSGAAA